MVSSIRHSTAETSFRLDAVVFAGLGISLTAYYFTPQIWLALPFALLFLGLSVLRLDLALTFVLLSAPFYLFPKSFGEMAFSLTEFTTLACFTAFIVRNLKWPLWSNRKGLGMVLPVFRNPVVIFAFAASISLLISEFPKYSLREYRTTIIEPLLFYVVLVSLPSDRKGIWRFFDTFVLLGALMAAFSIYHYFFVGVVEATGGVRRVLAIYHSPNALALFLGRVAPLAVLLTVMVGGLKNRKHLRPFYLLASLLITIALFITYSRGAWLAVAISLSSMLILWTFTDDRRMPRTVLKWLFAVFGLVVVGVGLSSLFLPTLSPGRLLSAASNLERLYVWQAALAMIRDHPLFGVGLDNFLYQYPKYMVPEAWAEPNISHPHNMLLDYWLRLGLLGLFALFALQTTFWRAGLRLCRQVADREIVIISFALMGMMADVIIHGVIDNSFFLIDLAVVFWFIYGLMQISKKEAQ